MKRAAPALEERGQAGKSTLFMLPTDVIVFTFCTYIRSSLRFDPLLSSGVHDLQRNARMAGSIYL